LVRVLFLVVLLSAPVVAQPAEGNGGHQSLDARLLRAIYALDDPFTTTAFQAADWTFYPVIVTAIPVAWAATSLLDDHPRDWGSAYRLTLSQLGATAAVYVLKYTVGRERPFAVLDDIEVRDAGHREPRADFSFPSGHAGLSFAIATSLSLSYPEWYVMVPALGWATAVALARPWGGVHYPSDIAVGAALGAGTAFLVHRLGDAVVPPQLRSSAIGVAPGFRMLSVQITF
jgi:membrane-associated phospholipid phosphatase